MKIDINKTFADYHLIRLIGQSAMTCVYEAETSNGTRVFLKIHDNCSYINAGRTSVLNEASLSLKLHDKAFLKLKKSGTVLYNNKKLTYLCYEFFEYKYLRDYVVYHNFDEVSAFKVIHKILQGLRILRDTTGGCCHFNISPENIIFNTQDCFEHQPYIIGLDHVSTPCKGNPDFMTNDIDQCFRAPETFLGWFLPASDVYSVGLVLYYMIMCKLPYPIDYSMDTENICKVLRQSKCTTDVFSKEAEQIIHKAISINTLSRYSSVDELDYAIMVYLDNVTKPFENDDDDNETYYDDYDDYHDDYDDNEKSSYTTRSSNLNLDVQISAKNGEGFKAVAGMTAIKQRLHRDFIDIVLNRKLASKFSITPPNMLFFGPPGSGKSYLTERLSEEVHMDICHIKPSDLGSIWIHGSQSMIKKLFDKAETMAKMNKKGVLLVIEEFDAVTGGIRDGHSNDIKADEVAEWLSQLNNCVERNIYVIGTTNRINQIDPAILRHGRIDQIVYIGMPELECRKQIFELELKKRPHKKDINVDNLAAMTDGFTSSDISYIVKETARNAFEANVHSKSSKLIKINEKMLIDTINDTRPSVTQEEVMFYEHMRDEFFEESRKRKRTIGFHS